MQERSLYVRWRDLVSHARFVDCRLIETRNTLGKCPISKHFCEKFSLTYS